MIIQQKSVFGFAGYTPETYQWNLNITPKWKGKSSSKPPVLGLSFSRSIFGSVYCLFIHLSISLKFVSAPKKMSLKKSSVPKDHWTLKTGYFEDPTPAIQVQTLPLEGPRSLRVFYFFRTILRCLVGMGRLLSVFRAEISLGGLRRDLVCPCRYDQQFSEEKFGFWDCYLRYLVFAATNKIHYLSAELLWGCFSGVSMWYYWILKAKEPLKTKRDELCYPW